MKCKRHPYENGDGVCASCLRERLFALLADQADDTPDHSQKPEPPPPPPPIRLPPSASPYARGRLSCLFYRTPQVGPSSSAAAAAVGSCWRRGSGKSSLLSSLFRHSGSEKAESDSGISAAPCSSSWLSVLVHRHREKKNSKLFAAEEEAARRSCHVRDRGMSPDTDSFASGDECYTESPGGRWRPTPSPMRRPVAYHYPHHHRVRGVAGFAVCLSPLVRASPGHWRRQTAGEVGFSGELRSTLNQHHRGHGAASLGPCRSKKLADFGRPR